MNQREKEIFIRELVNNVQKDLLTQVARLPEEWDGHELRQLIADRFAECSFTLRDKQHRRRYRDYKNFIATTPLR